MNVTRPGSRVRAPARDPVLGARLALQADAANAGHDAWTRADEGECSRPEALSRLERVLGHGLRTRCA